MSTIPQENSGFDLVILRRIGLDAIQNIICLIVEAVMYTILFGLVVVAGRLLLQKRTKFSIGTFGAILILLLLDTVTCVLDVNNAIREITFTLTSSAPLTLNERYNLKFRLPFEVSTSLLSYMLSFGDLIIVWRVYIFWCHGAERFVMIIPAMCLLTSFAMSGFSSLCVAREVEDFFFMNNIFCGSVMRTIYCITLVITILTTGLVCYKIWVYRREIKSIIGKENRKTICEKVMIVIIESGLLYFFIALTLVISSTAQVAFAEISTEGLAFANSVWSSMTSHILCMYPPVMVIVIRLQKADLDQTFSSTLALSSHNLPSFVAYPRVENDGSGIGNTTIGMANNHSSRSSGLGNVTTYTSPFAISLLTEASGEMKEENVPNVA